MDEKKTLTRLKQLTHQKDAVALKIKSRSFYEVNKQKDINSKK